VIPVALVNQFLSGAIFMACVTIAVCFLRYWKRTHDRFFVVFSLAFLTLATERIFLLVVNAQNEFVPFIYLVRLAAFLLIIGAIIDKNRR
jgi:hypothetical protein